MPSTRRDQGLLIGGAHRRKMLAGLEDERNDADVARRAQPCHVLREREVDGWLDVSGIVEGLIPGGMGLGLMACSVCTPVVAAAVPSNILMKLSPFFIS